MKYILTIIIPCYNCESTIERTLNSIINLTNVEIILVDDGSTDNTKNVIKEYLKYDNIQYIYQENSGPGSARNKGIDIVSGNYIMFLDSDDYVETINLKELIEQYLIKNEYDVLYYNFDQISETGEIHKSYNLEKFKDLKSEELIKNTISWKLPWGQFKVIKTNILSENNIYFDEDIRNSEELFFTINVLSKSKKICFYDKVIYKYVRKEDSVSRKVDIEEISKTIEFMIERLLKVDQNQKYNKQIYNYYVISNIHLLKFLSQNRDYKSFKDICKIVRNNIKNMEDSYIATRYKIIVNMIKFHMDLVLYLIFTKMF